MDPRGKICIGMIAGAHGVRGQLRVFSFTEDPSDIESYGDLGSEDGTRIFALRIEGVAKDHFVASMPGIKDRDQAEALKGTRLYVGRETLPPLPDGADFYEADLLNLRALNEDGTEMGVVLQVHDHGAGPNLEIGRTTRDSFMLPFKAPFVGEVNLKEGTVQISVPQGWLTKEKAEKRPPKVKKGDRMSGARHG